MPRRGSSSWVEGRSGPLALLTAVVLGLAVVLVPAAAEAESPTLVKEETAVDGVYVAPSRTEVDVDELVASVQRAQALGLRVVAVVPDDPRPTPAAFARRVQEATDADAAVVFPPEGGLEVHVIDEFESARFRAVAAARSKATPALAVDAFAAELLAAPSGSIPSIVSQLILGVLALAGVLVVAVVLEQLLRRMLRRPPSRAGRAAAGRSL